MAPTALPEKRSARDLSLFLPFRRDFWRAQQDGLPTKQRGFHILHPKIKEARANRVGNVVWVTDRRRCSQNVLDIIYGSLHMEQTVRSERKAGIAEGPRKCSPSSLPSSHLKRGLRVTAAKLAIPSGNWQSMRHPKQQQSSLPVHEEAEVKKQYERVFQ